MLNKAYAQQMVFPVIKYGGVFDIPAAVEKPDPTLSIRLLLILPEAVTIRLF